MKTHTCSFMPHRKHPQRKKSKQKDIRLNFQAYVYVIYGHFQMFPDVEFSRQAFRTCSITHCKTVLFQAKTCPYTLCLHSIFNPMSNVILLISASRHWGQDTALSPITEEKMGVPGSLGTSIFSLRKNVSNPQMAGPVRRSDLISLCRTLKGRGSQRAVMGQDQGHQSSANCLSQKHQALPLIHLVVLTWHHIFPRGII